MTVAAATSPLRALEPPEVNAEVEYGAALQDAERAPLQTAGESSTIREPRGALAAYVDEVISAPRPVFVSDRASYPNAVTGNNFPIGIYHWVPRVNLFWASHLTGELFDRANENLYSRSMQDIWQLELTQSLNAYRFAVNCAHDATAAVTMTVHSKLDALRTEYAARRPSELISRLTDEVGLSQLSIARVLNVTPTAVRKWRRGESIIARHRDGLAELAALCTILAEVGTYDPGTWLEIPISNESTITPLDLAVQGRTELVVLFASHLMSGTDTLDLFDSNWRSTSALDPDYVVVALGDGSRSAVPRREANR